MWLIWEYSSVQFFQLNFNQLKIIIILRERYCDTNGKNILAPVQLGIVEITELAGMHVLVNYNLAGWD